MEAQKPKNTLLQRPLEHIAFWQFLCFLLLIAFVWTVRSLNLLDVFFGARGEDEGWYFAWIITIGIIVVGFVTVGQTYVQERRALRGLIVVCSYCHRVRVDEAAWQQMERFVSQRTLADFTHGICPKCFGEQVQELDQNKS